MQSSSNLAVRSLCNLAPRSEAPTREVVQCRSERIDIPIELNNAGVTRTHAPLARPVRGTVKMR